MKPQSSHQLSPNDIPFGIENAVLAFALDLAGVPEAEPSAVNIYTRDMLFEIGGGKKDSNGNVICQSRFAGLSLEDAARKAYQEGEKGSVKYRFQRVPELGALLKAFTDQEKILKHGATVNTSGMAKEIARQMVKGEIDDAEGIVRLACVVLKLYITYKRKVFEFPPYIKEDNPGKTKTASLPGGGKLVESPGYRLRSINASQAVKDRLRL